MANNSVQQRASIKTLANGNPIIENLSANVVFAAEKPVEPTKMKHIASKQLPGGSPIVSIQMMKTKICADFQNGKCSRGDGCPYAHGDSEIRPLPDLRKTKMCTAHIAGRCTKENCRFAHSKEELRFTCDFPQYKTEVCRFHTSDSGRGCKYGEKCPYAHSPVELRSLSTISTLPSSISTGNTDVSSNAQSLLDMAYTDDETGSQTNLNVLPLNAKSHERSGKGFVFPKLSAGRKRATTVAISEDLLVEQVEKTKANSVIFPDVASIPIPQSPDLLPKTIVPSTSAACLDASILARDLSDALLSNDPSCVLKLINMLITARKALVSCPNIPEVTLPLSICSNGKVENPSRFVQDGGNHVIGPPPGFESAKVHFSYSIRNRS
ncbi:zinc finger (CCCH type) motif-containing protein [Cardiosporidium cionae]|uniref:Zinc finger (CCCH type) motif-containing protein n=1 Tax=Cardiosporidium cionae TaxID=476202 RepID=A0ABQ7JEY2_9APIC|nr:zinc finger (CCCH type) motif-containing protein [Cardiosporidium cionae]|eukprot:KAF8822572.1 zinc finger (CCCH type) motif-containing protein [Cardiosporidium cionae]